MGANDKPRNRSIDIFRFFCAILVVVIHTLNHDYFISNVVIEYLSRIAVPFFLIIAGYFYYGSYQKNHGTFPKYLKKTVTVYAIWSIPYLLLTVWVLHDEQSVGAIILRCIEDFCLRGSYYHFWFFVALIIAILFCTVFYKFQKEKILWVIAGVFYIINCMGTAYYNISVKVPVLSSLVKYSEFTLIRRIIFTGIPFFALGAVICKIDKEKIKNQN